MLLIIANIRRKRKHGLKLKYRDKIHLFYGRQTITNSEGGSLVYCANYELSPVNKRIGRQQRRKQGKEKQKESKSIKEAIRKVYQCISLSLRRNGVYGVFLEAII